MIEFSFPLLALAKLEKYVSRVKNRAILKEKYKTC
jgi:hypothetical protein